MDEFKSAMLQFFFLSSNLNSEKEWKRNNLSSKKMD